MTVTTQQAMDHVRHALGGPAHDLLPALEIVNRAGAWLFSHYDWQWLHGRAVEIGVTAGQSYIDLPSDFGQLEHPVGTDYATGGIQIKSMQMVLDYRRRTDQSTSTGPFIAAVRWDLRNGRRVPILELAPTPSQTEADKFLITYKARWVDLVNDQGYIPLPQNPFCDLPYLEACRALVLGWEEEDEQEVIVQLQRLAASEVMRSAYLVDGTMQRTLGRGRGSAALSQHNYQPFSAGPVALG